MLENEEELEFDSPLEEEIEETEVQQGRNRIFTDQGDPEIESLHNKWKRGKLVVQPEFQRQFVWDPKKPSRKTLHVKCVRGESGWSMMLHWIILNNTGVAEELFLRTLA